MLIAYTWENKGSNSGRVTGFDRLPEAGESSGTVSIKRLKYGYDVSCYSVIKGEFKVNALTDIDKQTAYEIMYSAIDTRNSVENLKDFTYQKTEDDESHTYTADYDSIQGVQNDCLARALFDEAQLAESIPVPDGMWETADTNSYGMPIYVKFTIKEFLDFATMFMKRAADNFGVKKEYKYSLLDLLNDDEVSSGDILNFDFNDGWY